MNNKRWIVLVAACVINLCIGTGYAWSVFAGPWAQLVGQDWISMAMIFAICNAVGPITMISGGWLNSKLGPNKIVFIGGVMFGGGVLLSGLMQTLSWLFFGYSILMGLGMGMIYGTTVNSTVKWFPDKRGMIGGLTTASYGLGSVILAPVAAQMVQNMGIANTFKILGIVYLIIICGGSFFMFLAPANFVPEGWTPPAPAPGMKAPEDKNWKQMLADPAFFVMFGMILCGAFFGLMLIPKCSPIAQQDFGVTPLVAANVVLALALCNAAGRVCCGTISDKIGRINTMTLALIIAIVGLLLMTAAGSLGVFAVGICCVGFTFGAFMGVYPGFVADQFGPKNNGVNYGIMFIGFAVAGLFAAKIVNMFPRPEGGFDYPSAYKVAIVLAVIGLVLTFVFRAVNKKK